jgi:hypothetical protein
MPADQTWRDDPNHPGKHIDPATGIWPISEWGSECGRGFVSDARFARGGERVIKRTSRAVTRKWRGKEYERGSKTEDHPRGALGF